MEAVTEGQCIHCSPVCHGGAAHNARKEAADKASFNAAAQQQGPPRRPRLTRRRERAPMIYGGGENVVDQMIRIAGDPHARKTSERVRGFAWRNRIRQRDVMLVKLPGTVGEYPQWHGAVELAYAALERKAKTDGSVRP